ncbi:RidA family protein [Gordonia sp. ABSL49_1]|uniref:RidA family protein n=1 Tax=Gordonia sp. ABSL49_1 TaxID=2920941 RepID=UPI001F102D41|nr:RidA family protein [Gordonia sp. ABSL49_1]MCH5642343.1 RidA family protein [Gordonia sp. ABSL49_1]
MTTTTSTSAPVRINPSTWNEPFRFDHAQLRPAPSRTLSIAGQASVDEQGQVLHEGDVAAQISLAMHNIEEILRMADMSLADVTMLTIYTTDVPATLAAYSALTERLDTVAATPPAALVGVTALAFPGLAVEITAQAAR